jgi:signal transduction histidine kinase
MKLASFIQRWGLLKIFSLLGFVSIISISIVSGFIYFSFLQQNMLQREVEISSEFIQSVSLINGPEAYFQGSNKPEDKRDAEQFFQHIISVPDIFRVNVFDADYKIVWSNSGDLVGKTFRDNDEVELSYTGASNYKLGKATAQDKVEHDFFPPDVDQFVETYIPIWSFDRQHVIGVVELYHSPRVLFETLKTGRMLVASVSILGGLILYVLLYWIVRTAHQLIESQRIRIKQASNRAVELNEQNLRRIGAELHDGPAQLIGFALLKLDSILEPEPDFRATAQVNGPVIDKIRSALNDSLQEVRSLSAGLVIPELKDLSARDAVLKVIERHQKQTSTSVRHELTEMPDKLSTPTKICIYRLVQEGLNNAYRHGKGIDQFVSVTVEDSRLVLTISDGGPGMDIESGIKTIDTERLGLRGMRERVESLGGDFQIANNHKTSGVRLVAELPIDQ